MNIITTKQLQELFSKIITSIAELDTLASSIKLPFNGEIYITDRELSARLHVSRRTTQEWRNSGVIGFIQLEGKVIYPESSIQRFLEQHFCPAWP